MQTGGIDFIEMWEQMGISVKLLMGLLALMSMWSMGIFFERLFINFFMHKMPVTIFTYQNTFRVNKNFFWCYFFFLKIKKFGFII